MIAKVKLQSFIKSPVTPESPFPVECQVARPVAFSYKAVLSLVKFAPKYGVDLSFKCTWILMFYTSRQGNKKKKQTKSTTIKRSHSKYASHTWVIPHKPTARAIQKDVFDKKEGKYGCYRK